MNQPPNWPQQGFQPGAQPGFQSPPIGAYPQQQMPMGYPQQQMPQGFPQQTAQMPGQQPNFNANPFAGLTPGEPAMTRYPYLEPISPVQPATFKLSIAKVRCHRGRNGKLFYIVEADITESNNPQRPVGMRCSAMIDMSNQDTWRRHVIGFLAAVYGVEPGSIVKDSPTTPWDGRTWEAVATASVHDSNPLVGTKVGCVSTNITVQKTGKPWTLNEWRPADKLVVPPVQAQQVFPQMQMPSSPAQVFPPPQGFPQGYPQQPQGGFGPPAMPPQAAPGYQQPPQGAFPPPSFAAPPQGYPQQPQQGYPQQAPQGYGAPPPSFATPPQQGYGG